MLTDQPLVWAESAFPPKVVKESYSDADGVLHDQIRVSEGWLTRPWQQTVLEAPGRRKVVRVSRRAGKSIMASVKCMHVSSILGHGVLVFAPTERQVAEIYQTCHEQFMNGHPEYFNDSTIKQDKTNPYVIRFNNGGFISFITAGTKSGGRGEAARGQGRGVKLIYIDEADYLSDEDIEAILAIQIQDRSMEVLLTSTPTGKRGKFYQFCTDPSTGFREFHFTCWEANPDFSEEDANMFRRQYGVDGFNREFMAEFGDEVRGVFDKEAIAAALKRGEDQKLYPHPSAISKFGSIKEAIKYPNYGYAQALTPNPSTYRIVGVDWDKYGAGTQIVIIEATMAAPPTDAYSKAMTQPFEYIQVIHRREIPKSQFTLTTAVRELIQINKDFSPDYFYLDAGYGEHQIESLQMLGLETKDPDDPNYKLQEKIRRVNFSQGIEIIDPASKQPEKRRIKPEMVNRLVNEFDQGNMIMSPYDDEIKSQLENYVVEKITASGEPKYTSINEHIVDGLMLAVWGLHQEFGNKPIKLFNAGYIDGPIGQRYKKLRPDAVDNFERVDYLAAPDEIDRDNLEDDLRFAKSGYINKTQIVTSAGVPDRPKQNDGIASFFQRGGSGHIRRGQGF
jgi:replicative DNA helicase